MEKSHNEDIARVILGKDVIFPDKITKARSLSYSEEQLKHFADTLPAKRVLYWCRANNYAIMPAPPEPMSLIEVRSLKPDLFHVKSGGWYTNENFAKNDKTAFGWFAMRKDIVPKSTHKTRDRQLHLLAREEYVPNAGEFAWFVTTYCEVHGVRLFGRIYARTSSVSLFSTFPILGHFGEGDLDVSSWIGFVGVRSVGLAAARKF